MTTNYATTLAELADHNPYTLASIAEVAAPDASDSPGAVFLTGVRNAVLEAADYAHREALGNGETLATGDTDDIRAEVADGAVPVYTFTKWQTFVDLAAWQEDISELGTVTDMDEGSNRALYLIAGRLAESLLAELTDAITSDDTTDGE